MPRAGGGSRPSSGSRPSASRSTGHRTSSPSRSSSQSKTTHRPSTSSSNKVIGSTHNHKPIGGGPSIPHNPPPPPRPTPRHMTPPHPHRETVIYHHYDSTPRNYNYGSTSATQTGVDTTVRSSGGSYYNSTDYNPAENARRAMRHMIKKIVIGIAAFVIIIAIICLIANNSKKNHNNPGQTNNYNQNQVETVKAPTVSRKKEKLDKSLCNKTDYWSAKTDSLGYFDKSIENGLKTFYDKTGVQPYVMTVDISDVNKWDDDKAIEQYETLFGDEGHFLLIVFGDKDGYSDLEYSWVTGYDAETVLDDEAMDVLWYYIDTYYSTNMSDSEVFSNAFADTAKNIMK